MTDNTYYLTTLNQLDNPTDSTVRYEIELKDDFEMFAARFINGLVMQVHYQTGSLRPIGETTAVRIAHELFTFTNQMTDNLYKEFDITRTLEHLRLDIPHQGAKQSVNLR